MVLDEVWRGLDDVGALSNAQGGPLSRTVKLILDPLVIRPVLHPSCAGPLVTGAGAALLVELVSGAAEVLAHTAAWFTLLKQVRRQLRITEGNPQDLYFPRCYELAVTDGAPEQATGRRLAAEELRELHGAAGGRTTQALRDHVVGRLVELTALVETSWAARRAGVGGDGAAAGSRASIELIDVVLNAGPQARTGSPSRAAAGTSALAELAVARAGTAAGVRLWGPRAAVDSGAAAPIGFGEPPASAVDGWSARDLGLTEHHAPRMPQIGTSASKAALGLPLDRTVHERVFTSLQTAPDRADLPPIAELVTEEIGRACAPWGLTEESLRVAVTVGVRLAIGLRPLGETARTEGAPGAADAETEAAAGTAPAAAAGPETAAHRVVNGRWRREAYVLQARRLALTPRPRRGDVAEPVNPLDRLAADLRTPWQSYLRRLWVRLHGRDVRDAPADRVEDLWDVLDGVARSVILDHRTRVRHALSLRSPRAANQAGAGAGSNR
ncbi:hypothetical protein UA75_18880 [Actinoalloteichus sp. GBA129-24]|uniref:Uncharacterized protein n=2 Tax=Pseudonocardiaceae TaxID=2070 RepID=A0AAC9LDM6_9PSEU|nr:hypothetical protein UA74_18390 [Actinoalloteichus fjordicus]APU21766.1 hypothetical protein UA75_18880 [Actinoalloteichus sp. GBA129-24]